MVNSLLEANFLMIQSQLLIPGQLPQCHSAMPPITQQGYTLGNKSIFK